MIVKCGSVKRAPRSHSWALSARAFVAPGAGAPVLAIYDDVAPARHRRGNAPAFRPPKSTRRARVFARPRGEARLQTRAEGEHQAGATGGAIPHYAPDLVASTFYEGAPIGERPRITPLLRPVIVRQSNTCRGRPSRRWCCSRPFGADCGPSRWANVYHLFNLS